MLIDLHAHTSKISTCCKANAELIIKIDRDAGIDGIVLTNHYQKSYAEKIYGSADSLAKAYTDEYYYVKKLADESGFKAFYGMEVSMAKYNDLHMLIYGISPEFTLAHPYVYELSHADLYKLVHDNGGMLVQAHPFRSEKHKLMDLELLDGLEANSHPIYNGTFFEKLTGLCQSRGIIMTSGGDYHHDTYRAHCGTYLPESILDEIKLKEYLMTTAEIELELHEPNAEKSYTAKYVRKP